MWWSSARGCPCCSDQRKRSWPLAVFKTEQALSWLELLTWADRVVSRSSRELPSRISRATAQLAAWRRTAREANCDQSPASARRERDFLIQANRRRRPLCSDLLPTDVDPSVSLRLCVCPAAAAKQCKQFLA